MTAPQKIPALYLYVRGSSWNDLHVALSLAATQLSLGGDAHLYLTWGALRAHALDELDELPVHMDDRETARVYQRARDRGTLPELAEMLASARELGTLRIYGCSTSAQALQLSPQQLGRLDAILGHASFLEMSAAGRLVVV